MAEQHEYEVQIGGIPHTLLLTQQQAKERGLSDSDRVGAKSTAAKAVSAPRNKARTASKDKSSAPAGEK